MTRENDFSTFSVGDPVNFSQGSDRQAGTVTRITGSTIFVKRVKAELLNGCNSGEPDALHFEPGGFVGHISGIQRWSFGEPEGEEIAFTKRKCGRAKQRGTSSRGSMSTWGILHHGHAAHYDFNF